MVGGKKKEKEPVAIIVKMGTNLSRALRGGVDFAAEKGKKAIRQVRVQREIHQEERECRRLSSFLGGEKTSNPSRGLKEREGEKKLAVTEKRGRGKRVRIFYIPCHLEERKKEALVIH